MSHILRWLCTVYLCVLCVSTEHWPIGELDFLDVDLTKVPNATGDDVIEATLDVLDTHCILNSDRLVVRRLAKAVQHTGNNWGGIWQVTNEMLTATKRMVDLTQLGWLIQRTYGLDWANVATSELSKPFHSALTLRLYLQTLPKCSLPRTVYRQAEFLLEEIPLSNPVNVSRFIDSITASQDGGCYQTADVVFILDGSGDLEDLKTFTKNLTGRLNVGSDLTRIAVIQFSASMSKIEFQFDDFITKQQISQAIDNIQYLETPTNITGDIAGVLRQTVDLFTVKYGARSARQGVTRIAFLLTYGTSNDTNGTSAAVRRLYEESVSLYAYGIGDRVDATYLQLIGSDCQHSEHLTSVTEMYESLQEIQYHMCEEMSVPENVMRRTLLSGERINTRYYIDASKGFKLDLSTKVGELKVYISTKIRKPSIVSHQWKCRADMTIRGSCYIPSHQLKPLLPANTTDSMISLYVGFTTNTLEGTVFFSQVSSSHLPMLSSTLSLFIFLILLLR